MRTTALWVNVTRTVWGIACPSHSTAQVDSKRKSR